MSAHSNIKPGLGPPGQDLDPPPTRSAGLPRTWIAILGLVILAAIAAGYGLYRHEESGIREERSDGRRSISGKYQLAGAGRWLKHGPVVVQEWPEDGSRPAEERPKNGNETAVNRQRTISGLRPTSGSGSGFLSARTRVGPAHWFLFFSLDLAKPESRANNNDYS